MQWKRVLEAHGEESYVVILETGDEVMEKLGAFAEGLGLDSASFTAIGAFERAVLAYFDWDKKDYLPIPVEEQTEVASLTGDIVLGPEGATVVHVHAVLGRRDGSAVAGHLLKGFVRPTLEVMLTETPGELRKQVDATSGLPLIRV